MKRALALTALGLVAIFGMGADDCSDESSDKPDAPTMARPTAKGSCPGQMFVGQPELLNFKVTNPGKVTYPNLYFAFFDGAGPFVQNFASGGEANDIEQGGFQFDRPLKPGQSRKLEIVVTPKDAGNFDALDMGMWGGEKNMNRAPFGRTGRFECSDITINP